MFDVLVGLAILVGLIHGARRGFVRQAAGFASALGATAIGLPLSKDLARLVDLPAPTNRLIAFSVLFILMSVSLYLLAGGIRKMLVRLHLKTWDGVAGSLLGAVKGFALATVLTLAVLAKKEEWRPAVRQSAVAQLMGMSLEAIHPIWPSELRSHVHPYVHYFDVSVPVSY